MKKIFAAIVLSLAAPALAVKPAHWVHTNEADFKPGQFEGVVATNLGDLKLSRAVRTILEQDPRIAAVYALVEGPDGTIYAGTGPEGIVLRVREGKTERMLQLADGTSVFALAIDRQGRLLIGASGNRARLLRIDEAGAQPTELLAPANAQYIWAIAQAVDDTLYLATGPNGELHQLNPDGTSKVLLKTDERNFLSLAYDGRDTLYIGTDPNGLVYRVNRQTGELFVLYDAAESEVSALVLDDQGNVYAGTSEAVEGGIARAADTAGTGPIGRPESEPGGVPIPAQPPADPTPPELPDPNPSEPDPIPTTQPSAHGAARMSGWPVSTGFSPNPITTGPAMPPQWQSTAWPALRVHAPHGQPATWLPIANPLIAAHLGTHTLLAAVPATAEAQDTQAAPGDPQPPAPGAGPGTQAAGQPTPRPARPGPSAEPRPEGNAIYRIDADGFVTELFRGPVMIFDMIHQEGRLIVGTGSEGLVYQIDPRAEETVILADLEPQQVMKLLPARDGRIYLGLANTGGIAAMSEGFAPTGTYTSPVLDATQAARFGKLHLEGTLPAGTAIQVSTRSGNVREPSEKGWSAWSEPVDAQQFLDITAPPARFLQYRLLLKTTAPNRTPVVGLVDVAYQLPNLPPRIQSITLTPIAAEAGTAPSKHTITWLAADPNGDDLVYSLDFRQGTTGPWIALKDNLTENTWEWPTRSLADGRYYVRVTASDARANPLGQGHTARRISDRLTIDNTPPLIGDLDHKQTPAGLEVSLRVVDHAGTVAGVEYAVDSAEDWQAVLPSDTIFDSPAEAVRFIIPDLKPGPHQVSIRATDAAGNRSLQTLQVTLAPGPANE